MFGGPWRTPPRPIDLLMRRFEVHWAAPRPLLRFTPGSRSLNTESPFVSRPVVMLYGSAEEPWRLTPMRTPRARGVLKLRSEEHTSELQSQSNLVCRLLLEKTK